MLRASTVRGRLPRVTSALLVALLALGVPGPALNAFASEPPAPDPGMAALSVASDPVGAAVYVNGRLQGQTPLTLNGVTPGEHRVRLVKNGYVENTRVVSLKAGQPGAVQVRMTPASGDTRHTVQQDTTSGGGGGGGGKKLLLIGLGVAAVGAGAFLLIGGNKAPTPGTISVAPTGSGMAGATTFTFTSSATDPDGDPLTFTWNFGDGASGSGQTATHVYASAGSFSVTVTVSDGKKSATATGSVTVAQNLSAAFTGRVPNIGNPAILRITQSGGNITGTFSLTPPADRNQTIFCNGTCTGSISGSVGQTYPATVAFSGNITGLNLTFSGSSANGGTITGTANWTLPGCCSGGGGSTFTRQ